MLQHLKKMSGHSASLLLLLVLSADFVFIVLHIIIGIFDPNPALCDISGICAFMNVYHLIKLFWITVLLAYLLIRTEYRGYVSWILMFTFFLFDDALLIHQNIGDQIAKSFAAHPALNPGLPPRFFELAVLAIAGMVLLAVVAWTYFRSPYEFRKISNDMLLFIALLVFFGLIVDVATTIKLQSPVIFGLGIVEDGGELAVDSLIVCYVFLLAIRNGKPDLFLLDLLGKNKRGVTADRESTRLYREMRG
jgi:hypothetical protein